VIELAVSPARAGEFDNRWPAKKQYDDPTITKTMESVRAAIPKAAQDATRPRYHFRPPAQWMNDICGAIHHKGYYHIFYQLNAFGADMWGVRGSSWAHARSRDLTRWEHLPVAIVPSSDRGEMRCNSGSVALNGKGTPMIFYTYVPAKRGVKREQWAAVALDDDLRAWRKLEGNPLMAAGSSGVPADMPGGWSDPFLFRAGGRTFATFKSSGGTVCEAQDAALTKWKYAGRMEGVDGECPNFLPLGGKWVLLRSTYPPSYLVGRFDPKTIRFRREGETRTLDHAYGPRRPKNFSIKRGFYGTNVLFDAKGRCLLFGWVSGFKTGRGWNGCMSLPRVLTLGSDGRLIQAPAPELQALRGKHVGLRDVALRSETKLVEGARGDMVEILARFAPGTARAFGLRARRSADGKGALTFRYDGQALDAAGTRVPLKLAKGESALVLHVFLDKSVMEVFINGGRECVTQVVYPGEKDLGIEVFAEGGQAKLLSLDVWQMSAIWHQ
jgi:beta-fructofuranosidase